MHVQEKQAWFVLIVAAVTLALWVAVVAVFGFHPGSFGVLGFFGFSGFAGVIGLREYMAGTVIMDERDKQIALTATTVAFWMLWVLCYLVAIGTMGPVFILGAGTTLTLRADTICGVFCGVLVSVAMTAFVVRSLIIVVLYRRGSRA